MLNRFTQFTDWELTELWDGLTMDDGIRYGLEESSPEYQLGLEMYEEAKRRGLPEADEYRWENTV